jgi:glycosyltransferase involved in cell wall biosynthesis
MQNSPSRAPTILAVVALPPPAHGQALVTQAIIDKLSATNVCLKVINTSPGSLQKGLKYHRKRMAAILWRALPAILGRRDGVLYTTVEAGLGICYNFLVALSARAVGLQIVLHHHTSSYAKIYHRRFDWLSRLAGKQAFHVALDEAMARDLQAKYSSIERVVVVHNASYVGRPAIEDRGDRRLACGFMSNLTREKGLDFFLDFFRAARNAELDLQAVLAGPATSREIKELVAAAQREFGNTLNFLGPVAGPSKEAFFRSIDIFLLPTRHKAEAQPLVILEAMSYGVPVVTSQQGYCAELVGGAGMSAQISEFQRVAMSFVSRCSGDGDYLGKMRVEALERFEHLRADADRQMISLIDILCSASDLNDFSA